MDVYLAKKSEKKEKLKVKGPGVNYDVVFVLSNRIFIIQNARACDRTSQQDHVLLVLLFIYFFAVFCCCCPRTYA